MKTENKEIKETFLKVMDKLEQIACLGFCEGKNFEGIIIDESGITYKSSTHYSGCGTDHFSFDVTWEELLERDLEDHKQVYTFQCEKERKDKEEAKKANERHEIAKRKAEYERLKKEFDN